MASTVPASNFMPVTDGSILECAFLGVREGEALLEGVASCVLCIASLLEVYIIIDKKLVSMVYYTSLNMDRSVPRAARGFKHNTQHFDMVDRGKNDYTIVRRRSTCNTPLNILDREKEREENQLPPSAIAISSPITYAAEWSQTQGYSTFVHLEQEPC